MYSIIRDSVPMEYDNDENTWRRPSSAKVERSACHQIPRRSTTVAVVVLGLAVLSCLLGYCVLSETLPYESKTLRLVIIIFRHGARTPVNTYNSDPYKNYQWPDGLGGLTNVGKLQLYELGKKYRSYYANFIPEEYCEKDVFVRSSDKSRCMMSAYTFLAGLYPPSERQMWHPDIPWQPIPVHSLPKSLDNIVASTKPCKVWQAMYDETLAERNADPKYVELFDYLSKHTNQSMRSILPIDFLYSTLMCEQEAGLKLPEWTKTVFPGKMRTPFMESLAALAYNETMQRFYSGPLLKEIKQYFDAASEHESLDRSLLVYSGHDVTLVSLWRALGRAELLEPEYGASLVLELHEDVEQEAFFVKTFFRNNTKVEVPMELKLPFCDDPCTYSQFSTHIAKIIPDDWEAECGNTDK
ncbi:prostatic acid phosphatase-like isoform X1 [Trichoplusia ni]|uniref:Prostatic acid phosphatase-like isoform X1 n=1 Tax=Trichoplusia ni TaxID=7111 RepID=A0A7E5VDI6_TRINI|nr:prostatic acid phosphatase-like isoform X1 [Trichoplusia ni]